VVSENVVALALIVDDGNGAIATVAAIRPAKRARRDWNLMVFNTYAL
jgi:hypothetical protein